MDFVLFANQCVPWVDAHVIARIVKVESSFNPYAIGIVGNKRLAKQPKTMHEAKQTAQWLLNHGYQIAMGLGQIYYKEMPGLGYSLDNVFDPCQNLRGSGIILSRKYSAAKRIYADDQMALRAAISSYNTGSFTSGFKNGYVKQVVTVKFE